MENVDAQMHARDFLNNLRRKIVSFDPKYSILLNTLKFPQIYMTNTVALTDDNNSWLAFLSERLKLKKLYRSGPAAFGSLSKLVKLIGLPRVKFSQFLAGKPSYMKFKIRRQKFPTLQVNARFIIDI